LLLESGNFFAELNGGCAFKSTTATANLFMSVLNKHNFEIVFAIKQLFFGGKKTWGHRYM